MQFDPAIRAFQPRLQHFGMMIAGIVEENVDHPLVGIRCRNGPGLTGGCGGAAALQSDSLDGVRLDRPQASKEDSLCRIMSESMCH